MTIPGGFEEKVRGSTRESIAVKEALLRDSGLIRLVAEVAGVLVEVLRAGQRIFLFGNGGSAADAQHIAAELVGRYKLERAALPAIALTVNSSNLTAIGNDYSFDVVFARQIEALGSAGDVAIGITTSGNSRNVILAIEAARRKGMPSIGLTGRQGGQLKGVVDRCICVPSDDTPRIQEAHILVGHILSEIIETELFGAKADGLVEAHSFRSHPAD